MRNCLLSFTFFILSLSPPALATVRVIHATQATWPPYVFDNRNSGLAVDIVQAAYSAQNYHVELEVKPWLRALKEVNKKQKDVLIALWWSDSRTGLLAYSVPYLMVHLKFIVLKENAFNYSDFSSLTGMKIGVIEDHGYGSKFNQSTYFDRLVEPDLETNIRKLKAKRIDAILADERAFNYTIRKLGLKNNDFHFVHRSLMIKPIHLAISENHPNKDKLLVQFMIGLHTIKENGMYDRLLEKYR
ncbi:transporter substrate-binding domain-containing protein [Vibrio kyushuensis]|uniref:transporter substrate-binding domain-containing protein n=1 Tax=Vibrio TaxID=662 RepID=UPI003D0BF24A